MSGVGIAPPRILIWAVCTRSWGSRWAPEGPHAFKVGALHKGDHFVCVLLIPLLSRRCVVSWMCSLLVLPICPGTKHIEERVQVRVGGTSRQQGKSAEAPLETLESLARLQGCAHVITAGSGLM